MHSPFTCPMCNNDYDLVNHHPEVLPCGCAACNKCVQVLVDQSSEFHKHHLFVIDSNENENNNNEKCIRVMCTQAHIIPLPEGHKSFPRNHLLEEIVQLKKDFEKADLISTASEIVSSSSSSSAFAKTVIAEHRVHRHEDEKFIQHLLVDLATEATTNPVSFQHIQRELNAVPQNLETVRPSFAKEKEEGEKEKQISEFAKIFTDAAKRVELAAEEAKKSHNASHHLELPTTYEIAVVDSEKHRVLITRTNGVVMRELGAGEGEAGSGALEFNNPTSVDCYPGGLLAVCDQGNKRISIFKSSGVFVKMLANLKEMKNPRFVCFLRNHNNFSQRLIVADAGGREGEEEGWKLISFDVTSGSTKKIIHLTKNHHVKKVHGIVGIPHTQSIIVSQENEEKGNNSCLVQYVLDDDVTTTTTSNQKEKSEKEKNVVKSSKFPFPSSASFKGNLGGIHIAHFLCAAGHSESNLRKILAICDEKDHAVKFIEFGIADPEKEKEKEEKKKNKNQKKQQQQQQEENEYDEDSDDDELSPGPFSPSSTSLPEIRLLPEGRDFRRLSVVAERDFKISADPSHLVSLPEHGPVAVCFLGYADESTKKPIQESEEEGGAKSLHLNENVNNESTMEFAVCDAGASRVGIFRFSDGKFVRALQTSSEVTPASPHRKMAINPMMVQKPVGVSMILK